ncbi:YlbF family regulator [Lactobacillus sp. DCY120]|uniref:UPF0342 protein HU830_06885 n=1 Tax=Bombilactobacillus apium TaxID=2675299 RepID=A0A850R1S2_9LACO|nr:YlbF family regulator [Bombilactobacillus apium]
MNVYDTANQLEQDLRQTEEVLGLQAAFAQLKADPMAFGLFQQLQQLQDKLQTQQANNEELDNDTIQQLQTLSQQLSKYDVVQKLMEAERKVNGMMEQLNQIISKPIADIYNG